MSGTYRLSDYQIRIGSEDVIERHRHGILSDDPESSENQEKAQKELKELLKEMRVRFRRIFKIEKLSFPRGVGACLALGSVPTARTRKPLEKTLLDKAGRSRKRKLPPAGWPFSMDSF